MNKFSVLLPIILAASLTQTVFAKDKAASVKKSCLKDYPLAVGDTDPEIIGFYNQLCDKKNKKNENLKNEILVDIAKKYQANGYNLKALQAVNLLREKNYQSPELTDVTFLAGIAISYNALNHMRSNENRTLDEQTYSPAKVLSDNIRYIQPTIDKSTSAAADVREKSTESSSNVKSKQTTPAKKRTNTASTKSKQTTTAASKKKTTTTAKTQTTAKKPAASGSPFDTLKNK